MLEVLKDTVRGYGRDAGAMLAGAIAFFAVLSAAPMIIVAVAIAGLVWGEEAARGELFGKLSEQLGPDAAALVTRLVEEASRPAEGVIATTIGAVVLFWASSRLFAQLQFALNAVWSVRVRPMSRIRPLVGRVVRKRILSFAIVLFCGVLLMALLAAKTGISALDERFGLSPVVVRIVDMIVSTALLVPLIGGVYKLLPDVRIGWRDVWVGAAVTSVLLVLGSFLGGLYLSKLGAASPYGAAGAAFVILLWAYYSAQIFMLGAELTGAWARHLGHGVTPEAHAVRVIEEEDVEDAIAREERASRAPTTRRAT